MLTSEEKKIHEDYHIKLDNSNLLRYKWYKDKYFKNLKGKKILEIGCGDGGVVQFLKDENEVYGVDISKNALGLLEQQGIKGALIDISKEDLPFKDSEFDVIIILEILEHLKSPQNAIEEIQRVLKKNGKLIISIPNPRTGHKFIYPSLFQLKNFKRYLLNNKFLILSTTSYGICPPFWKLIDPFINKEFKKQKQELNKSSKDKTTFLSKISKFMSSDLMLILKPKIFGWSFIYECLNTNPAGTRELYKEIVEETKIAYD